MYHSKNIRLRNFLSADVYPPSGVQFKLAGFFLPELSVRGVMKIEKKNGNIYLTISHIIKEHIFLEYRVFLKEW